jgi:hypothetical protein
MMLGFSRLERIGVRVSVRTWKSPGFEAGAWDSVKRGRSY